MHQHLAGVVVRMSEFKVWSAPITGRDGHTYAVRYLLTDAELTGLQSAGLIGDADEVVGLQSVADGIVAMYEREAVLVCGGSMQ